MTQAGGDQMTSQSNILRRVNKILVLNQYTILFLVVIVLMVTIVVIYYTQALVEQGSLPPFDTSSSKEQYEIAKLAAEIRQIRSDTSGSLFWLKLIALFVTVGSAVGGYLIGQSHTTKKRIEFENRKNVDAAYQAIVQELSDKAALLRAAAAVKLGAILKSFPSEWSVDDIRKEQLIQLTKQVLAAALTIEKDPKVQKTLTIVLVLHKRWENDANEAGKQRFGDARELDLSGAKAADAYWARVDFSYADFYRADLTRASFRGAILYKAEMRDAKLKEAVLIEANCEEARFKLADLRNADLSKAQLIKTNFDGAKVNGCILTGATVGDNPDVQVDNSALADGSEMISARAWLAQNSTA